MFAGSFCEHILVAEQLLVVAVDHRKRRVAVLHRVGDSHQRHVSVLHGNHVLHVLQGTECAFICPGHAATSATQFGDVTMPRMTDAAQPEHDSSFPVSGIWTHVSDFHAKDSRRRLFRWSWEVQAYASGKVNEQRNHWSFFFRKFEAIYEEDVSFPSNK